MGGFSWRGAGAELGEGKDGFNQLDLIEIKKKILFPKWSGRPGRGSADPMGASNHPWEAPKLLLAIILGVLLDPLSPKGVCGGIEPFPFPQKSPGTIPKLS